MTEVLTANRIPLENYAEVVGAGEIEELRALAKPLRGRSIEMINSTAVGGGVAEILNRLVPLAEELDLGIRWEVMQGAEEFFDVTKSFHNALHGEPYHRTPKDFEIFLSYNERNRASLRLDAEFVVIHDPQPAALVDARQAGLHHWVWRCHIDLSHPHRAVWDFLEKFVSRYDAAMFSSPEFSRQLSIPQYLFYPAIDPLSEKNCSVDPEFVEQVLHRYHIDPQRPILTQISRFDRLKDPVGVIRAYRIVKRYFDCQLVLAGGSASDDPEGALVLQDVLRAADEDPDIKILELPAWAPLEVNALQRASTIVVQKSLREGFGLTVSEALWKKKPVVASAVGGIPTQIIHKHTGLLAHSVEGTAYQIRFLLSHPEIAAKFGENGHEHVKENFLITQKLKRYLALFLLLDRH
ncbi:MAG: glycosyl transferase family 1 [Acidobacteria bacterium]|nr:MAG: glycosyl transferase family 1 [Acidobacteriota bacterium]PYT89174.1 MAG: glycosyl transferase family 1 [Acidobacteriota bacterium]